MTTDIDPIHRCARCGQQTQRVRIVCRKCAEVFISQGICGRCGAAPATTGFSKQRGCHTRCEPCKVMEVQAAREAAQRLQERLESFLSKYRDRDARENTRETKSGG